MWHSEAGTNKVALAQSPKPVTVVPVRTASFRAERKFVGTLEPWVSASVGPQLVSAYVDSVLVRPGAVVKRGQVLATLDCRNTSAGNKAVAMQARAVEAHQRALADEAARTQGLLEGGFVSPNEAELKTAQSSAEEARLMATQADLAKKSLEVDDCVLRAPFDGEVATRSTDPGAFVRPGAAIVSVVDRATVRFEGAVPEVDFALVAPGTAVRIVALATKKEFVGQVARRAPASDVATRTIGFEVDLPDPEHEIPVGTTGEVRIDVGVPVNARVVPLNAASVRGAKATVFVLDGPVVHSKAFDVLGEKNGELFLNADLTNDAKVVTEGRTVLRDGDSVAAKEAARRATTELAKKGQTP